MERTYENNSTVKMVVLNPEEPCISLRECRFEVYKDGVLVSIMLDQYDAVEFAKGL